MFTINGIDWNLRLVGSPSPMLMRSDGTYTFGMTDRNTRDIYISNILFFLSFYLSQSIFVYANMHLRK